MENFSQKLAAVLFLSFALLSTIQSQESSSSDIQYEINRMYPALSIDRDTLDQAKTLVDLNRFYKESWVKEYLSVEITTTNQGVLTKAEGTDSRLTQEQINNMDQADVGSEILVDVHYIPENNLSKNDPRREDFKFTIDPENEARYQDGDQELREYLHAQVIANLDSNSIESGVLAAIKFTISEEGQVINTHLFESSRNEKIDQLLVETIRSMPDWKPAEYWNGTKTKQDFVFTVGSMESCIVPLLNIRQD